MDLIKAIKENGSPYEIPNASRDDLPQFFKEMGYQVGAEIGVLKGEFSEKFCREGLKLYAIDPWGIAKLDAQFEQTKQLLLPYPNCTIIRKTSMEAVEDFEDESLDFVYIDGNHSFRYIAEDLVEWTKKIKKGGIVSGHDYFYAKTNPGRENWHVAQVLNAYTQAYGISNWYLIGRKNIVEGEKRDKWRSWMFVKL